MDRDKGGSRDYYILIAPDSDITTGITMDGVAGSHGLDGSNDASKHDDISENAAAEKETKKAWLTKLTSATENETILRRLISRTPMLSYLETMATIRRPHIRRMSAPEPHAVRAVAIGPRHRGEHERALAFDDETKRPFVRYLQQQWGLDVERYIVKLREAHDDMRREFADDIIPGEMAADEEKFLTMLVLDSCFIFVVSILLGRTWRDDGKVDMTREIFILQAAVAQHADDVKLDMLLLDNQIPFDAIKMLYASCDTKSLIPDIPVEDLVLSCFDDICPRRIRRCGDKGDFPEFHHVLHLFHWSRVPDGKYRVPSLPRKLFRIKKLSEKPLPSATELRESAVWFWKKRSSERTSGLDINFWSCAASPVAVMAIPALNVCDYSGVVFHNLIAFEKHWYWLYGACATSYAARMEGLLQCELDAALLRRRGVLASTLKTDKEVVEFFKELGAATVGAIMPEEHFEMFEKVTRHHKSRARRCLGEFVAYFFPTQWVAITVAAGVALFVLTLLQTIYTMRS